MALLGNKYDYIDDEQHESDGFQVPAVFQQEKKGLTLKKSIVLSTILHPTAVGLAWLIAFALMLMGVKFTIFDKPEPKPKDIEFVLVNKEAPPINKNTPFRADRNSRAGGKHDPSRKVSMPSAPAPKAKAAKAVAPSAPAAKPKVKKQQKQAAQQSPIKKLIKQSNTHSTKPATKAKPSAPAPKAAPYYAPRPKAITGAPKVTTHPKSNFAIPVPKSAVPRVAGSYGGPITAAPKSHGSGAGGYGSGSGRPSPSFSPTGSGSGSGSGSSNGRFSGSRGGTGSGGNYGNPGPGNRHGAPGIDAIREADFGPYMRDLQRRIKMNWNPSKADQSNRVILQFSIARDGRPLNIRVYKSSGIPAYDRAAISAVQLSSPFKPLPAEFKGSSISIQFTFDYNVLTGGRY